MPNATRIYDRDAVIKRLRELKQQERSKETGVNDGRDWAAEVAEPWQLRRLARFAERRGVCEDLAHDLYAAVDLERNKDHDDFWAELVGEEYVADRVSDTEYLNGFINGAIEVWDDVKDHI